MTATAISVIFQSAKKGFQISGRKNEIMAKVTDMTKGKPAVLLLSFAFPLIVCIMGLKPSPLGETFRSIEEALRLVGVKMGILTLR